MTGRLKKQKPHTQAFVEFLASALAIATAGFRSDEWLAVDRIFQQAGLPLRLLQVGPEETISTAKSKRTNASSGKRHSHRVRNLKENGKSTRTKRPSHRQIRIPSSSARAALCDLIGISSDRDLRETLEFARLVRDSDRARAKQDPTGWKELQALDRQVRGLALRRAYGDVGENLSPPNTLSDLKALPKLIRLDHTRLCAWYVQHLIRQVQIWSTEGNQTQRNQARHLVEEIGKALVLSAGRCRPPGARGAKPGVTRAQALQVFDDTQRPVKESWMVRTSYRTPGHLLQRLQSQFGESVIERALGGSARRQAITLENWLSSADATPSLVTKRIAQVRLEVSRNQLTSLLTPES